MRALELALRQMALIGRTPKRSKRARPPTPRFPSAARVAYLRGILDILKVVEDTVRRDVFPLLPVILGQHNVLRPDALELRIDDTGSLTEKSLSDARKELERRIPERQIQMLAQENALRVSEHSRGELERQIRAVARIDLFDHPAGLATHIDAFVADNVRLVKSVAFDQLEDLKGVILRGARLGHRHEEVAKEIQERFGMSKRRAALIATDQVASLNGELAQLRQQQVGIKHYIWSSSKDERVRKSHRAMDGSHQRWDKPPMVDGVPAHPGQPIRCRCQAIPDVDDVLREAGLLGPEDEAPTVVPPPGSKPSLRSVPPAPSEPVPADARRSVPAPPIAPDVVFETSAPPWMSNDLTIIRDEAANDGINAGRDITVRDIDGSERRGMWKLQVNEKPSRPSVRAGTYHVREAAMYELDKELGPGAVVPPTVSRVIDGKRGSLQLWDENGVATGVANANLALEAEGAKLAQHPSVRRMFLLDVIAANDDRHGGNVLWRKRAGRWQVAAPDNGLAFPEGRIRKFWFPMHGEELAQTLVNLDAVSVNQVKSLQLSRVAAILHRYPGITPRQIREALARIRSLQLDPQQLARLRGRGFWREKVQRWISLAPEKRGLSNEDLATIEHLSESLK